MGKDYGYIHKWQSHLIKLKKNKEWIFSGKVKMDLQRQPPPPNPLQENQLASIHTQNGVVKLPGPRSKAGAPPRSF